MKPPLPNRRNFNVVTATTTVFERREDNGRDLSLNPVVYLGTAGPPDIQRKMVEAINQSKAHRHKGLNVGTPI